jgi:hypothetical protein
MVIQIGKKYWDLEICRKTKKKYIECAKPKDSAQKMTNFTVLSLPKEKT